MVAAAPIIAAISAAAPTISLIGTAIAGVSALSQASANAKAAGRRSAEEERLFRRDLSRLKGQQKTGFLSSGVTLEGTPLLVLEDTAREGEIEAQGIKASGASEADAIRRQGLADAAGSFSSSVGLLSDINAGTLLGSPKKKRFKP